MEITTQNKRAKKLGRGFIQRRRGTGEYKNATSKKKDNYSETGRRWECTSCDAVLCRAPCSIITGVSTGSLTVNRAAPRPRPARAPGTLPPRSYSDYASFYSLSV
ncbi:hypothetical protein EVAR_18572_1 [Eumeta japonica]|uniref:Uncharacterized protein n=1 Tax=Eumeta variegata TaxID=151549 RepID=A0A4C1V2P3_EUMVA|nr:hypothetical protein EVAR_18572_1 [Eumeta japonica]